MKLSLGSQLEMFYLLGGLILISLFSGCASDFHFNFDVGKDSSSKSLDNGFVDLKEIIPELELDIRYFGNDNFIGQPIEGYHAAKAIVTKQTADALINVQEELRTFGLGLKIYDAYRPQSAVNHFVRWAKNLDDTAMKSIFYPNVAKDQLFEKGYIAEKSGHSRGSTIDLTIISLHSPDHLELDMGSPWDFFDPVSWPTDNSISAHQRANRSLLHAVMTKYGFKPLPEEWWHFTLLEEPYPSTYFDFPVQ